MAIITAGQLAPWVGKTADDLAEHPLAQPVIDQASLLVNEAVWGVSGEAKFWALPDEPAPATAQSIATALAARVFSNPRVVQQRSTGPMSERLADAVLTGMALRPDEIERLIELRPPADDGTGLWILPTIVYSEKPREVVPYVEAYQPHPPGMTYFAGEYLHG